MNTSKKENKKSVHKILTGEHNPSLYWEKYGWKGWTHQDVMDALQGLYDIYDADLCDGEDYIFRYRLSRIGIQLVMLDNTNNPTDNFALVVHYIWWLLHYGIHDVPDVSVELKKALDECQDVIRPFVGSKTLRFGVSA